MKVRTQITLLLTTIVAAFVGIIVAIKHLDQIRFERLVEQQSIEWHRSFNDLLDRQGESLRTLVAHYSLLDGLVPAIADDDRSWLDGHLNEGTLNAYSANVIWICKRDFSPVFVVNNFDLDDLKDGPLTRNAFSEIFARNRLCHFFRELPARPDHSTNRFLEVWGATVHPAWDSARSSDVEGCFFAARLWTAESLKELSQATGARVRIASAFKAAGSGAPAADMWTLQKPLADWNGKPIAWLVATGESSFVNELNRQGDRLFVTFVACATVIFFVLGISLMVSVNKPLRLLMGSLKTKNSGSLKQLQKRQSEFGEIARLIDRFFEQREDLIREMNEHVAARQALRESEERLRHSQKMEAIGRLAGGVAHDFNNLLTAIIGYADLLMRRLENDPVARQNAALIRKAGQQAADLTCQLLAFSRKQLLQPRVIDLNLLVTELEKLLRRLIGEHIELTTLPEAAFARVKADPTQIEQVILNLGINARDAMPKGGTLTIRTANVDLDGTPHHALDLPAGSYVALEVTDTGVGMDNETKSRIFEPFFTTKDPGKGTGLGLASVYGVVKQSGGAVAVESEPGCGSTFRIFLPIEQSALDAQKSPLQIPERSERGETILVVEDEEVVLQLVHDVLTNQGYRILVASNGAEALQVSLSHENRLDLLITDVVMPQMNGNVLAQRLNELRPGLKVLFVSGYSEHDISAQGILDSNIEILQKPFSPELLARKVREMLHSVAPVKES